MTTAAEMIADAVEYPTCWFIHALEWPGGDLAEGAVACSPYLARRVSRPGVGPMSDALDMMLRFAEEYAQTRGVMAVFASDLSYLLGSRGRTWEDLGIDFDAALAELEAREAVGRYFMISERAHTTLCDTLGELTTVYSSRAVVQTRAEREPERAALRGMFTDRLMEDWPPMIRRMRENGSLPG